MNEHVKTMTEVFEELAVVTDPVSEEDRVVHLLLVCLSRLMCWSRRLKHNQKMFQSGNSSQNDCCTKRQNSRRRRLTIALMDERLLLQATTQGLRNHLHATSGHFKEIVGSSLHLRRNSKEQAQLRHRVMRKVW